MLQEKFHNELSIMQVCKDYKEFYHLWNDVAYSEVIRYLTLNKAKNHYVDFEELNKREKGRFL